jgi:DNA-3-methyladenine glycosylase
MRAGGDIETCRASLKRNLSSVGAPPPWRAACWARFWPGDAPTARVARHRITEVEAYDGENDLACHASKGRTKRTEVMYRPGGVWYVYLCYGVHEMLNLVTGPADYPAAVLIRGVEGISGPGRLTKRLAIDWRLNGADAIRVSGLWIEDDGFKLPRGALRTGPRIDVNYAGPKWAGKPWRFWIKP